MSSLAQIETPQKYYFKVMSELLVHAHMLNVNLEEFAGFLGSQVQAMLACPPNYNKFGKKARAWIMRGFYPGTTLFFKLAIATADEPSGGYYVKASPLRVHHSGKKG